MSPPSGDPSGCRCRSRFARGALVLAAALVVASLARHALADDLFVSSAAVDQPRINIGFAPIGDPTNPFFGEGFDPNGEPVDTHQINAFWDTGASGIVLSEAVAEALSMSLYELNGENVLFRDVSPGGSIDFHVSEQVVMRTAPSLGFLDNEEPYFTRFGDPNNFMTAYDAVGPVSARVQVGPVGATTTGSDINVAGMPTMIGRKVVIDPRPTDQFITLLDEDPDNDNFDAFVRAYSYDAAHAFGTIPAGSSDRLLNPGIPTYDRSISLSYADFGRYTELIPAGADLPTQTHNPFLGPNPLDGPQLGDSPAPILRLGAAESRGSWLLDTGAAASFISTAKAAELNVSYDPANPVGSEDPRLLGVPESRQFDLAISGISGQAIMISGFYADSLTLFTDEGDWEDPNDPNHLNFVQFDPGDGGPPLGGAPVLVFDITLENPNDPEDVYTIDGIFGMNFLVATADFDLATLAIFNPNLSPFDAIVFDEPAHKLYLSLNDSQGWPIPEPAGAGALLIGLTALLSRRRGLKAR